MATGSYQEKVAMVETMNEHIKTLREKGGELVKACRLGQDLSSNTADYQQQTIGSMKYSHVHADTKSKELVTDASINSMVFAAESLLGLVSQLKKTYIVRAPYRDEGINKKNLAQRFDSQTDRIKDQLKTLSEEMNVALKDLESTYLSSRWTKLPQDEKTDSNNLPMVDDDE
eukprot:CAMPEP_0185281212 /NCGR_PEP_ID=MMETSP1359-20130426/66592_1 /TAXON_ID=552665 /ORGANISM="Bigelowiella longifila, Strain CCMP242" /LENGTH=171 /DNA_ID=CAMNT_0027876621 /DNA_START=21 /DNA_END=536 /DNA_ORIENTATION=+